MENKWTEHFIKMCNEPCVSNFYTLKQNKEEKPETTSQKSEEKETLPEIEAIKQKPVDKGVDMKIVSITDIKEDKETPLVINKEPKQVKCIKSVKYKVKEPEKTINWRKIKNIVRRKHLATAYSILDL